MYDGRVRLSFPDGVDPQYGDADTLTFKKPQLCWGCQRATPKWNNVKPCNWCKNEEPVDGWAATKVVRRDPNWHKGDKDRVVSTYHIHNCPMFLADEEVQHEVEKA